MLKAVNLSRHASAALRVAASGDTLASMSTGPCVSSSRICKLSHALNTRLAVACASGIFSNAATRTRAFACSANSSS